MMLHQCPARVFHTTALRECLSRLSCRSAAQECLTGVSRTNPNSESVGFQSLGLGSGDTKIHALNNRNSPGTVLEQSGIAGTFLEPSWNCTECPSGIPFRKSCRNLSGSHNKTCGFCLSLVLLFCIFFA